MDAAIAQAEREAVMAASKSSAAQAQLVEWTDGERAVIKSLKRLSQVIESPELQVVSNNFVETHRHHFEFTDENKLEYTQLHEKYVELMEVTLVELAKDINMDELISNLPEFMSGRTHDSDPEGTASTIDFLLSLTDFSCFKNLMLASNMGSAGSATTELGATSDAPLASLERTAIPKALVDTARVLLSLSAGDESVKWASAVDKKELRLETTSLAGKRYARMTVLLNLGVADSVSCMLNMADPDRGRWNQMAERVDVLRSSVEGKVHDMVCTIHLKLPGVAKLLSSIRSEMTVRLAYEEDLPAVGQVTYVMVGWDPKTDSPDTGAMSMTRVATLEPAGPGCTRIQTIDKAMQAVPEWVSNLWVSNTMYKQMQNDAMRYKKIKGIAA